MFLLEDGREHLFQWDINRRIQVEDPTITEVHFCNRTDECSLVVDTYTDDTYDGKVYADIPNIILQQPWDIRVYAYCTDGYTKVEEVFEVKARSKPADYVYVETEVRKFDELFAKAEEAITTAEESAAQVETQANELYEYVEGHQLSFTDDGEGNVELKALETETANSKPVYLDFRTVTADARAATEDEAAIFERLYAGEQILVNIRPVGRNEYLPSGYSIVNNTVRFIYNRVSHTGSGVNTGDNRIAIDAAWYRAQRAGDGTWTVWQSSGCKNVEVANKADLDAAVTELEDAIAAIEVSGGGSGDGANVYTLDFSDVTETARDATLAESTVLDKILARENLVLYITKNNISMPAEITYRTKDTLNLNYTRVRHRSGENISLTSIFYRAQHITGTGWTLKINDYYEDLMVASQDWVRAQFDGIAQAEGGAY